MIYRSSRLTISRALTAWNQGLTLTQLDRYFKKQSKNMGVRRSLSILMTERS